MPIYDTNKAEFPELDKIGDWLKNNNNNFLQSIYDNAHKWKLSDRQIEAAQRSWGNIGKPREVVTITKSQADTLEYVANNYLAHTYYNQGQSDFLYQMIDKAKTGEMSPKQYAAMHKIFYRFRKSILKKIFGMK